MLVETFIEELKKSQIETIAGVPDSLLSCFCDYLNQEGAKQFQHYVPANEGAAVGIAAGAYIASGHPALVYMQNSGIGNTINPIVSLIHADVYEIPMLFLIGWRGEPGKHDEPQHVYQGKITCQLCEDMEIPYSIIDEATTQNELEAIFQRARASFAKNQPYAIIARKNTFEKAGSSTYQNEYALVREEAITMILKAIDEDAAVVSTTGKISREVYEQSDAIFQSHERCFLTVGSMGHASMLAFGMAKKWQDKQVVCIDGDGAVLMHMGALAFLGNQQPKNLLHIVLNNEAHESVGGMPTGAPAQSYAAIAKSCAYPYAVTVKDEVELSLALTKAKQAGGLAMIEVMVKQGSRADLGRPKETPQENKAAFMKFHKEEN